MEDARTRLTIRVNGIQPAFGAEFGSFDTRSEEVRQTAPYQQANVSYSLLVTRADQLLCHVLIDAGFGVLPSLLELESTHGIHVVHQVLITHPHLDHFAQLEYLARIVLRNRRPEQPRPLPIHATEKCWQAGPARVFPNLSAHSVFHPFVPGQVLNFGELTILPFAVDHGTTAPGAVGYVVLYATRKFIFTGDFLTIPNDHSPLFRGADLCFMEATNWHPAPHTGHQSVTEAIRLLRKWTPLQTYLVHYSGAEDLEHSGDAVAGPLGRAQFHSRLAKIAAGQNIRLAEHGMTFEYQEEMQNLEWYRTQRA